MARWENKLPLCQARLDFQAVIEAMDRFEFGPARERALVGLRGIEAALKLALSERSEAH